MDDKDSSPTQPLGQHSGKKPYQRPSVQLYGTLLEMTQAVDGDVGHSMDGGHNVAGSNAHNRT